MGGLGCRCWPVRPLTSRIRGRALGWIVPIAGSGQSDVRGHPGDDVEPLPLLPLAAAKPTGSSSYARLGHRRLRGVPGRRALPGFHLGVRKWWGRQPRRDAFVTLDTTELF
jgi:hypothetical protein